MPSTSIAQQQLAGQALAFKRGDIPASKASPQDKAMAKMPARSLMEYAKTKHTGLPQHVHKK